MSTTIDYVKYSYSGTTATVTGFDSGVSSGWNLVIPDTITVSSVVYTVASIAAGAFYNCTQLSTVTMTNNITTIGTISGDPTDETQGAFANTGISSITLSSNLTYLGYYTFSNASKITEISIPDSVKTIGDYCFYEAGNSDYPFPVTFGPSSELTTIGTGAFQNSRIGSIEIPANVRIIPEYAFSEANFLDSLTFASSSSVTTFYSYCFEYTTNLRTITIPASVTTFGTDGNSTRQFGGSLLIEMIWDNPNNFEELNGATDVFEGTTNMDVYYYYTSSYDNLTDASELLQKQYDTASRFYYYGVPVAPVMDYAVATGATTANVYFTPSSDGGFPILSYTARIFVDAIEIATHTVSYTGQSVVSVTGLDSGETYTFSIYATNELGNSDDSDMSGNVTTFTIPSAPTISSAVATGSSTADIYYTPGDDGGTPILNYTVNVYLGNMLVSQTEKALSRNVLLRNGLGSVRAFSTISVSNLLASTSYTFTLIATNSVGSSEASARSNSITTDAEKAVTLDTNLQRIMQMSSYGQFWYGRSIGFPGFLYKKNGGGGCRRSTKFIPGLGTPRQNVFNTYVPGSSVGAVSTANRRALRRAIQKQTIKLGGSV